MFWTYCINSPAVADDDFPIPMSYLDVIMQGALEVGGREGLQFTARASIGVLAPQAAS